MSTTILGVDLGTDSVKVVEVKIGGRRPVCLRAVSQPVEVSFVSDPILERQDTYSSALREALSRGRFRTRRAICTASGLADAFTFMTLPPLSAEETQRAVTHRLRSEAGVDALESSFAYTPIGEETVSGEKRQRLLAVAARRDRVRAVRRILSQAGVSPIAVSTDFFALAHLSRYFDTPAGAVLDIGRNQTWLCIGQEGTLAFARRIDITGEQLTSAIQQSVPELAARPDAEAAKRRIGIPATGQEIPDELRERSQKLWIGIRPHLEKLRGELAVSLENVADLFPQSQPRRLYLSGGGAQLLNLEVFLTSGLGTEIASLQKGPHLNISFTDDAVQEPTTNFGVAIGLTLAHTSLDLTEKPVQKTSPARAALAILCGVTAAAIFWVFAFTHLVLKSYRLEKPIHAGLQDINLQMQKQLTEIEAFNDFKKQHTPELDLYQKAVRPRANLGLTLKEIARARPMEITIDRLRFLDQGASLRLSCVAFAQQARSTAILDQFKTALENSPLLQNVTYQVVGPTNAYNVPATLVDFRADLVYLTTGIEE